MPFRMSLRGWLYKSSYDYDLIYREHHLDVQCCPAKTETTRPLKV